MSTYHTLFAGLIGFFLGALAVGYGQQHQNEVRDRLYDARLLTNVRHEWRNDRSEQDLDRREAEISQREQRLASDEVRFADAKRQARAQILDTVPDLIEAFERLDVHGQYHGQIEELRRMLLLIEMRQRTEITP